MLVQSCECANNPSKLGKAIETTNVKTPTFVISTEAQDGFDDCSDDSGLPESSNKFIETRLIECFTSNPYLRIQSICSFFY